MFTNYMPYTSNTKAFLAWRKCISNNQKLRKQLALPEDKREDYRMCRDRYKLYMKASLKQKRKELHIDE